MFAAVKVYQDFNHRYPPRVEQYGLRFVSEYFGKCATYVKEHRDEFLEMHGHCFPAVVSFAPTDFPKTWKHRKESPTLCICAADEAERMAANIVQRL